MKYTLEQKAQLMALQNPNTYAFDFEDFVIISDGIIGYYVSKDKLLINHKKLRKPTQDPMFLKPENIIKATVEAQKTRNIILMTSGKMAIKLKAEDGRKAWVNTEYLKQFGDIVKLRISSEYEVVYISDYKGNPLGIVMPVRICEDSEVEE